MNLYGKILCGIIGYYILGPLGAMLGVYLGHMVDREETYGEMPRRKAQPFIFVRKVNLVERQEVFFSCVFSMLAKLARADGTISADEIEVVERFIRVELNLDPTRQKQAKDIFRAARQSNKPFVAYAREFQRVFSGDRTILENLLNILLKLSLADGKIVREEEHLLRQAAEIFNIESIDFDRIRSQYGGDPDRDYAILGCKPQDSVEKIKKQYRQLVKENHPDVVKGRGQPEAFANIAAEKFRAIQEAYESIRQKRGFA